MIMDPDEWDEREYNWLKVDDQYMRLTGRNVFHDVRVYEYDYNETETVVVHVSVAISFLLKTIVSYVEYDYYFSFLLLHKIYFY